jgi:hypothetical protein
MNIYELLQIPGAKRDISRGRVKDMKGSNLLHSVADPDPWLFGHPDPDPYRAKHQPKLLEKYTQGRIQRRGGEGAHPPERPKSGLNTT